MLRKPHSMHPRHSTRFCTWQDTFCDNETMIGGSLSIVFGDQAATQIRFGFSSVLSANGTPRFRVMGDIMMRWASSIEPLAMWRGVKRAEEEPLGTLSLVTDPILKNDISFQPLLKLILKLGQVKYNRGNNCHFLKILSCMHRVLGSIKRIEDASRGK
jgi:hypothetical protein